MLIGITGTDGAGKGEKVWETFARSCQLFCESTNKNSDKVYRDCKSPAPNENNFVTNCKKSC